MKYKLIILAIMLAGITSLQAQTYQIRAVNKGGGFVGVEVKVATGTAPTTADYVTDLVFGLKWLASYNVDLMPALSGSYHITRSGARQTQGIYHYQAFFADQTPFLFPANWPADTWVEIMSVRNTMTGVGTGTFEVVEAGFDITTQPNIGVSLADFSPTVMGSATLVPLPVNLTRFDALPRQNNILVQWVTSQEQNAKGFDVERADQSDPTAFKRLTTVGSKGPGGGLYEWTDRNVTGGVRYYYRLKQIDQDERFRYSDIRSAILDDAGNSIQIWPNPVAKELLITLDGITATKVLLKITDALGRVVMTKDYHLSSGRKTTVNVTSLMQGQYFLTVESKKDVLGVRPFFKKAS